MCLRQGHCSLAHAAVSSTYGLHYGSAQAVATLCMLLQ